LGDERLFQAVAKAGVPVSTFEVPSPAFATGRPGLARILSLAGVSDHETETCPEFDPRLVHLLVKASADPNIRFDHGETALMRAARLGLEEGVELLLDKGADLQLRDDRGRTAFDHALRSGNPHVVKMLSLAPGSSAEEIRAEKRSDSARNRSRVFRPRSTD
jgi:hypothetical protein